MVDQAHILVLASHEETVLNRLCNVIVRLDHGAIIDVTRKG